MKLIRFRTFYNVSSLHKYSKNKLYTNTHFMNSYPTIGFSFDTKPTFAILGIGLRLQ